jgi:hypothetical protein
MTKKQRRVWLLCFISLLLLACSPCSLVSIAFDPRSLDLEIPQFQQRSRSEIYQGTQNYCFLLPPIFVIALALSIYSIWHEYGIGLKTVIVLLGFIVVQFVVCWYVGSLAFSATADVMSFLVFGGFLIADAIVVLWPHEVDRKISNRPN